jgi:hypothetical protein
MDADSGRRLSKFQRWGVSVSWSADDRYWRREADIGETSDVRKVPLHEIAAR